MINDYKATLDATENPLLMRKVVVPILERACAACRWRGRGTGPDYQPGASCPRCGAAAEDQP